MLNEYRTIIASQEITLAWDISKSYRVNIDFLDGSDYVFLLRYLETDPSIAR